MENRMEVSKQLKIVYLYDLPIQIMGIFPKESKLAY
jgi:hypothetical protein